MVIIKRINTVWLIICNINLCFLFTNYIVQTFWTRNWIPDIYTTFRSSDLAGQLGFDIDSRLKKLADSFEKIHRKVNGLILKWQVVLGRQSDHYQITFTKPVLEISDPMAIQDNLNSFIFQNKAHKAREKVNMFVKEDIIYGKKSDGGFCMIRIYDFFHGLKCSWVRRYVIDMVDDHWADLLDIHLKLTPPTRRHVLDFGAEKFNVIVKKDKPCISGFMRSYQLLKYNFPIDARLLDKERHC